jgi:hypothetical protein
MKLKELTLFALCFILLFLSTCLADAAEHRDQFGYSAKSRQIALIKQSLDPVRYADNLTNPTSHLSTKVISGRWICPYTGTETTLVAALQGDHLVPLEWAWLHGADQWTPLKRKFFANDQENILIVLSTANGEKGERGPGEWLPPNVAFRPAYVEKFNHIVEKYGLKP